MRQLRVIQQGHSSILGNSRHMAHRQEEEAMVSKEAMVALQDKVMGHPAAKEAQEVTAVNSMEVNKVMDSREDNTHLVANSNMVKVLVLKGIMGKVSSSKLSTELAPGKEGINNKEVMDKLPHHPRDTEYECVTEGEKFRTDWPIGL